MGGRLKIWTAEKAPGITLCLLVAIVAAFAGNALPTIGGAVFGIVIGLVVNATGRINGRFRPGVTFSSRELLKAAIILLGTSLSLSRVWTVGVSGLAVTLSTLCTCLLGAWLIGRAMGVPGRLRTLIGCGTGICGASAIAAVSPVIGAEEHEVAYSISTIFLFNVIAVLLFPWMGHLLGLDAYAFGLWAGTAINDTSSVVAAAYTYGSAAGSYAVIVKLTRSTLIVPITLTLAGLRAWRARREGGTTTSISLRTIFPWFIVYFLIAALINTIGLIPPQAAAMPANVGRFLIVLALSGVGLSADLRGLVRTGLRPLTLGLVLSVIVALTSLGVQYAGGRL